VIKLFSSFAKFFNPNGCANSFLDKISKCLSLPIKIQSTVGVELIIVPLGTAKSAPIERASCLRILAAPVCKFLI
jgi:hypothetical protein